LRCRVKICGIKSYEEAKDALDAGADALGFVFAKRSSRFIRPEDALAVIKKLPPLAVRVGVFQSQVPEEVETIALYLNLDVVQLHGEESPAYCREIKKRLIKSIAVTEGSDLKKEAEPYLPLVDAFLLDTFADGLKGGTGKTFPWEKAVGFSDYYNVILAGGLNPLNVGQAISLVRPYAVDVASGVEKNGKKDKELIRKFVEEVKKIEFTR